MQEPENFDSERWRRRASISAWASIAAAAVSTAASLYALRTPAMMTEILAAMPPVISAEVVGIFMNVLFALPISMGAIAIIGAVLVLAGRNAGWKWMSALSFGIVFAVPAFFISSPMFGSPLQSIVGIAANAVYTWCGITACYEKRRKVSPFFIGWAITLGAYVLLSVIAVVLCIAAAFMIAGSAQQIGI